MTKTIIYSCVFFNEKYINLANLLLKSYKLFGNSSDDIDYLIICNPELKDKIQDIFDSLHINGKIWCVKLKSIFEVGYSKLQIFNYPHINSYNKILYLNYNVLITNSIHNILDLPLDNKLYAPQEGNTNNDLWGKQFFDNNPNCSAFTSDILLFNNNTIINKLFSQILLHINSHIKNNSSMSHLLDQPFIVYHAIKDNVLCKMNYITQNYYLSDEERSEIKKIIASHHAKKKSGENVKDADLFTKIAAIRKNAESKISIFADYIKKNPEIIKNTIIFVYSKSRGRQISEILQGKVKYREYFDNDVSEHLDYFAKGDLDCLITISRYFV